MSSVFIGMEGQLADATGQPLIQQPAGWRSMRGIPDVESRVNQSDTALAFGDVACAGTAAVPGQVGTCAPMMAGATVLGLTVRQESPVPDTHGNYVWAFPRYSDVPILKIGYIWATAAENVTAEDPCIGVVASPGAVGGTTGGPADGTTRLAFPSGWTWKHTVMAGGRGLIRALS